MSTPVLWFTGRPGSGKSTIADAVVAGLRTRRVPVELVDGSSLTGVLGAAPSSQTGEARLHWVAGLLNRHGIVTVITPDPADGPAAERARAAVPGLIEVFVDTPREICVSRIGSRANEPFANPVNPDLRVVTHDREVSASAAQVMSLLDTIDLTDDHLDGGRPWASAGA